MATSFKASNLAEMYGKAAEIYGDRPAFASKDENKKYIPVSYRNLYEMGLNLATGLIELGVEYQEHVALLSDNRLEWILADYGILLAGAADVPRGSDVTDADIQYILNHSDARVVFVENQVLMEKVRDNKKHLKNLKHIVMMDQGSEAGRGNHHIYDLLEQGRNLRAVGDRRAEERIAKIQPDDLFTLIYTSGTTGVPKGVMLTHANMISQVEYLPVHIVPEDRMLAILPVWHVFERVFEMMAIGRGCCTYYTDIRNIRDDMKTVRPTFMASAPRLWENVYQGILNNIAKAPPIKQKLFAAAVACSRKYKGGLRFLAFKQLDLEGRNIFHSLGLAFYHLLMVLIFLIPNFLLDLIVLKKIRAATGGKLKGSVSGGGALPIHVDEFFNEIGIPVLEGYGLTETCPVLAVRTFQMLVIGSVGPVYPHTELRLVDPVNNEIVYPPHRGRKGEIHVRGPQVMKGYYKNPEATEKVMHDGWFNTGDLGVMTFNNTLKIVGRSKETVVLMGGENVEPVPLENRIIQSAFIDQCMVVGQDKKYLCALIVPAPEQFKEFGSTHEELMNSPEVNRIIREEVKSLVNQQAGFKSFERIVDVRILPKPFEVGDEMTNIFKLKRHIITDKYKDVIESMYKP